MLNGGILYCRGNCSKLIQGLKFKWAGHYIENKNSPIIKAGNNKLHFLCTNNYIVINCTTMSFSFSKLKFYCSLHQFAQSVEVSEILDLSEVKARCEQSMRDIECLKLRETMPSAEVTFNICFN